jgi:hypothetical protein
MGEFDNVILHLIQLTLQRNSNIGSPLYGQSLLQGHPRGRSV